MGNEKTAVPALQHRDGKQETETARGRRSRSYDYSTQKGREGQSVRREYYKAVKELVPVPEAARYYSFIANRAGFISCPFHADRTPSLKLHPASWKCFSCSEGGSVIDFVVKLFSLSPSDAVRKLNDEFALGLPLAAPMTGEERLRAQNEADRRQFVRQSEHEFEEWKDRLLRRLALCLRIADDAAKAAPDNLYEEEALALRWAPFLTDTWESLVYGAIEPQIKVFCDRKGVDELCCRVLKPTLTRFMQN